MQRSDARKREAAPSEAGALTRSEREAVNAAVACGNRGERAAVLNLVARIKAEAVQAERERIERGISKLREHTLHRSPDDFDRGWSGAIGEALRIARGEGR